MNFPPGILRIITAFAVTYGGWPGPSIARGETGHQVPPGPWGTLECFDLVLEPTDQFVTRTIRDITSQTETVWRLAAPNREQVAEILEEADLEEDQIESLTSKDVLSFNLESGWFEIRPPEDLLLALNSHQRTALYPCLLPEDDSNVYQNPFWLHPDGLRSFLTNSPGVSPPQIERIRRLTYQIGESHRFSDLPFVLGKAENDREKLRITKTLFRQRALAVHLRLTDGSTLAALAEYWSAGGRNKDILPLLNSIVLTSGVDKLDIVHLLPPFPRKVLNTYPSPYGEGISDDLPDCFWTAYSFFSESPPDRYLDKVDQLLSERYERAPLPRRFGDLILFSKKDTGENVHACNYIAGDLVFTKNGRSMSQPWVIIPIQSVIRFYLYEDLKVTFYRLKPEYRK